MLILLVAGVLERILDGDGGGLDFDAIDDCVAFFRLYADAVHHGKEEDLLFPELEQQGLPRDGGPIGVMLHEHQMGRGLVGTMADSRHAAGAGDHAAEAALREAGRSFIDLIRSHIHKENVVLFRMADQLITGPACFALCGAYGVACRRRFEGRTRDELESLAGRLAERYPEAS